MYKESLQSCRRWFIAGTIVIIPIVFTVWLATTILKFLDSFLLGALGLDPPWGMGLLLSLFVLIGIGFCASRYAGQKVLEGLERWLSRIPLLGIIYKTSKQTLGSIVQKKNFGRVVVLEYPRTGIWALGFITNDEVDVPGGDGLTIFVPTTPNPTSGFLVIVPKESVYPLDLSPEDGIKFIVSLGSASHERLGALMKQVSVGEKTKKAPPKKQPAKQPARVTPKKGKA